MSDMPFRPQSPARSNWEFQPNSMKGLQQAVNNNQPLLALEYALRIMEDMEARIQKLEAPVVEKPAKLPPARAEKSEV